MALFCTFLNPPSSLLLEYIVEEKRTKYRNGERNFVVLKDIALDTYRMTCQMLVNVTIIESLKKLFVAFCILNVIRISKASGIAHYFGNNIALSSLCPNQQEVV